MKAKELKDLLKSIDDNTEIVLSKDGEGNDGNVFFIIGRVVKTLKRAGQDKKATEFLLKVKLTESYDGILNLVDEYVEVE